MYLMLNVCKQSMSLSLLQNLLCLKTKILKIQIKIFWQWKQNHHCLNHQPNFLFDRHSFTFSCYEKCFYISFDFCSADFFLFEGGVGHELLYKCNCLSETKSHFEYPICVTLILLGYKWTYMNRYPHVSLLSQQQNATE